MEPRIILALDNMTLEQCLALAEELSGTPGLWGFKLNDILRAKGYDIIPKFKPFGRVFADLKLKDIPNTVKNDVNKIKRFEPDFLTIHASGTVEMQQAAVEAAGDLLTILGVTVLTSYNDETCKRSYGAPVKEKVLEFATMAHEAGVTHLVSSAMDLEILKEDSKFNQMIKITPAIRPLWYQKIQEGYDDQKRKTTAREAIDNGADLIVIGRPIIGADDRVEAIRLTMEEIEGK